MTLSMRTNRKRIGFGDIAAGDRLRVRYTEGGSERGASVVGGLRSISVTRTMVAEAAVMALDRVWLTSGGHTLVHREWDDLEIIRLSDEPMVVRDRTGKRWESWEDEALRDWSKSGKMVGLQIGRTKASVETRRNALRKQLVSL